MAGNSVQLVASDLTGIGLPSGLLDCGTGTGYSLLQDAPLSSRGSPLLGDRWSDEPARSKELKGGPAQVRRITSIEDLGHAQIRYIGESDESTLKRRLARVAGLPVLVVTSQPRALDDGSTINFLVIDHHVRFEISLAAAQRSGLTISADLLSVATHVEGHPIGSEAPCAGGTPGSTISCSPRLASQ